MKEQQERIKKNGTRRMAEVTIVVLSYVE